MLDSLTIKVKAGDGGDGRVSFKREKFRPFGGPDGGDGGKGGDVILKVNTKLRTLSHLNAQKLYKAEKGEQGGTNFRKGKSGKDFVIEVPLGTLVYKIVNTKKKELLADLVNPNFYLVLARGGKGGYGNAHFKSSIKQAPKKFTKGSQGEFITIHLEIKLLADIGLVGLPSVGKSSLINSLTKRSFKTAPYPFTTLSPNIGVLRLDSKRELIIADLPGLIEGASKGKGLGDNFLRHIERCGLIVHVLDVTQCPSFSYEKTNYDYVIAELFNFYISIRRELYAWSPNIIKKPEIILFNKIDIPKAAYIYDKAEEYMINNILNYKSLFGTFFGKPVFFKVSAYKLETLKPFINFLKENYTKIINISHSISFNNSKSKNIPKVINLDNIPNKRIFFKN